MEITEAPAQPPKRRVLRLSVRALMVVVLLLAVGLGWVVQRAKLQREAIVAIEKTGGKIYYDWQWPPSPPTGLGREPKAPKWLVDAIGVDYLSDVVYVQLGATASDAEMEMVGRLPRITYFSAFGASGITDAGVAQLAGLNDLEVVALANTKVTGAALKSLRDKTRLKTLALNNLAVLDADLANIEGLTRLEVLDLSGTKVTDEGLAHLDRLVNLKELRINSTEVTGSGFGHLKGMNKLLWLRMNQSKVRDLSTLPPLPALWGLMLDGSAMDDASLEKMPDLPVLMSMTLMRTSVTDEGLAQAASLRQDLEVSDAERTEDHRRRRAHDRQARPSRDPDLERHPVDRRDPRPAHQPDRAQDPRPRRDRHHQGRARSAQAVASAGQVDEGIPGREPGSDASLFAAHQGRRGSPARKAGRRAMTRRLCLQSILEGAALSRFKLEPLNLAQTKLTSERHQKALDPP